MLTLKWLRFHEMTKRHKGRDGGFGPEPEAMETAHVGPSDGGEQAFPPGSEPIGGDDALKAQLAEKDKEIAELKDKYLRTLADSENARKRIRQQSD